MKPYSVVFVVAILLAASVPISPALVPRASGSSGSGLHLGYWLQESDISNCTWQGGYQQCGASNPAQLFFNSMFLTPPYPSSIEVMIFSILQAKTNGQPCSSASSFIGGAETFWGNLAQLANSYPNIRLVYEIAFDPSNGGSGTYGLSCFNTLVQFFGQYPSVHGLGVEGEYTFGVTDAGMQTALNDVTAVGKVFVSYYIHGAAIPQGGYIIAHTNFPEAGDQVGTLGMTSPVTIGLDSGYYFDFPFPQNLITCPIAPNAIVTGSVEGWDQCVVSTELSKAVSLPSAQRQFVELDVGFSNSGSFTGVSGQSTNQLWDNPTLRNWIWTDANYQSNFALSTSSTTTTTTTSTTSSTSSPSTTSTTSSSSSTTSTTSTRSRSSTSSTSSTTTSSTTTSSSTTSSSTTSSSTTSSSTSQTTSHSATTSSVTSSPPQDYSLSILGACPSTGAGSYPPGSIATVQFAGVCNRNGGSGLRVDAWSIDGGASGPVSTNGTSSITITMGGPRVLRLHTVSQYLLTLDYGAQASQVSITPPSITGDNYWYDGSILVTFTGGFKLHNYTAVSWALDGAKPVSVSGGFDFVASFSMSTQHFLQVLLSPTTVSCTSDNCSKPTFDMAIRTNTTAPAGVWIDGGYYPRSVTFAWRQGSVHNITAVQGAGGSSTRTYFIGWSGESRSKAPTVILTVNNSGYLTAGYSRQYLVSLSFVDASRVPLVPESVTVTGSTGPQLLGPNLTTWAKSGSTYTLTSVTWLGWDVVMANDSVFKVTQPSTLSFRLSVYPQTIKATDAYDLPLQGATVNVTALNGAKIFLVTDSQGMAKFRVPVGVYSANIGYLGTNSQVVTGSEGSHTYNVSFLLSYPLLATVSTVSAIAGAFAFLRLRRKSKTGIQFFSD